MYHCILRVLTQDNNSRQMLGQNFALLRPPILCVLRDHDASHARQQVGLGATGVLAEVVLQCVPAHQLLEHTFVSTLKVGRHGLRTKH